MFTKDIGIDLGTANTLVYVKGKGIIIREPSVVAVNTRTDKCRYVGKEAKDVIGRTPGSIVAVRPLRNGVIADFDITTTMLQEFFKKALKGTLFTKANVIICIPSGVTPVERRAVREACKNAGANNVLIIEEPMAAAIGAGLPTREPTRQHDRGHRRRYKRGSCYFSRRYCRFTLFKMRRRRIRFRYYQLCQEKI